MTLVEMILVELTLVETTLKRTGRKPSGLSGTGETSPAALREDLWNSSEATTIHRQQRSFTVDLKELTHFPTERLT